MFRIQFVLWVILASGLPVGRAEYYCENEGLFLNPKGDLCQDYYQCIYLKETWFYVLGTCENNTIVSATEHNCVSGHCQSDGTTTAELSTTPSTIVIQTTTPTMATTRLTSTTTIQSTSKVTSTTTIRPTTTTKKPPTTTKLQTTTSKRPTTSTTTARPTPSTPGLIEFKCASAGYFGDFLNCGIYHACIDNWGSWVHYVMPCPEGLVYCHGQSIASGYCGYSSDCPWIPCLNH